MNLKESFRYQRFLGDMMNSACKSLNNYYHCVTVTRRHLRSKANEDAEDIEEIVDAGDFYKSDDVLDFMLLLTEEREKLTCAIDCAKASLSFDLDVLIETNKSRQLVLQKTKQMLRTAPSKYTDQGIGYKINIHGNQVQYVYEIEVEEKEAFNRGKAREIVHNLTSQSDKASAAIDSALTNTQVRYTPPFNVNDSFNDVMKEFLKNRGA